MHQLAHMFRILTTWTLLHARVCSLEPLLGWTHSIVQSIVATILLFAVSIDRHFLDFFWFSVLFDSWSCSKSIIVLFQSGELGNESRWQNLMDVQHVKQVVVGIGGLKVLTSIEQSDNLNQWSKQPLDKRRQMKFHINTKHANKQQISVVN